MKVAVVDTTFSRINMGEIACNALKEKGLQYIRSTVPGIKDLAVECKSLLSQCDIAIALGMVGGAPIDTQCAHEASLGIQQAKLMTGKHIIEVFVHENEAWSEKEFYEITKNRILKHVDNVEFLLKNPDKLVDRAGQGIRQGKEDEGPLDEKLEFAIVYSEFNSTITTKMRDRAIALLKDYSVIVKSVPGVFDMPLVVKKLLMNKKIKGVVVLGAVIKGSTAHDEVIVKTVSPALVNLSLEFNKPIAFGIIGHDAEFTAALQRAEEYAERATKTLLSLVSTLREEF